MVKGHTHTHVQTREAEQETATSCLRGVFLNWSSLVIHLGVGAGERRLRGVQGCTHVSMCDRPARVQGLIFISRGRLATPPFQTERRRCRQRGRSQVMEAGPRCLYSLSSLSADFPATPAILAKCWSPRSTRPAPAPPTIKDPPDSASLRSPHPAAPNPSLWASPEPSPALGRQHLQSVAYSSPPGPPRKQNQHTLSSQLPPPAPSPRRGF